MSVDKEGADKREKDRREWLRKIDAFYGHLARERNRRKRGGEEMSEIDVDKLAQDAINRGNLNPGSAADLLARAVLSRGTRIRELEAELERCKSGTALGGCPDGYTAAGGR